MAIPAVISSPATTFLMLILFTLLSCFALSVGWISTFILCYNCCRFHPVICFSFFLRSAQVCIHIETGNFYQAAEKCNVSQSAISQQIKKLEQELGVKLLDRHNRTFSLTPAGEHFYRKSLILVSDIEQIKRETKRIADNDHATLRIGYYKGYHGNELSEAVAEFSSKYPTVEVNIFLPSIIWTSDTFRRKFLFLFLRWFTTCSIGTSVVMSPEESTMHTIF